MATKKQMEDLIVQLHQFMSEQNSKIDNLNKQIKDVKKAVEKLEHNLSLKVVGVEDLLNEANKNITDVMNCIKEIHSNPPDGSIGATWAEVAAGPQSNIEEVARKTAQELQYDKEREKCLMIFGIEEDDSLPKTNSIELFK